MNHISHASSRSQQCLQLFSDAMCNQKVLMSTSVSKELCVYSFKTVLFLTRTFQESVKFAEQWNCPVCCLSAVFNVIGWMKEAINSSALIISSYAWVCSVIELCWALQSLRSISRHRLTDKHLHLDSIPKTKRHINIPAVCLHDSWYLKTDDRPHHALNTDSTRHQTELSSDSRYSSSITAVYWVCWLTESMPMRIRSYLAFMCFF